MTTTAKQDKSAAPGLQNLWSGGAVYLGPNTHFRITAFNSASSVTLRFQALILRDDGEVVPYVVTLQPTSDRLVSTTTAPATSGWLLSGDLIASSGSPRRGQCFARVQLSFGRDAVSDVFGTIVQGYVTDTAGLSFNGSPVTSSADGPGVIRSITGTDPAANTEVSETVPTNARWRPLSIALTLVTDATAANREVALVFDDGTTVFMRAPSRFNHAASLTRLYSFGTDQDIVAVATDTTQTPSFTPLMLMGGFRIRTITTNLQATDNYGAPQLLVEEWIED